MQKIFLTSLNFEPHSNVTLINQLQCKILRIGNCSTTLLYIAMGYTPVSPNSSRENVTKYNIY